uniref:Uncharacterized protein n=1 Tax=Salix viminalis TaxID=40686 RepID=A0A6N2ND79_SALVM
MSPLASHVASRLRLRFVDIAIFTGPKPFLLQLSPLYGCMALLLLLLLLEVYNLWTRFSTLIRVMKTRSSFFMIKESENGISGPWKQKKKAVKKLSWRLFFQVT